MARKQQSALEAAGTSKSIADLNKRIETIREQRLKLEAQLKAIEERFANLIQEEQALVETKVTQPSRRKLRYPTP